MLPSDDCDDCVPHYAQAHATASLSFALFALTFAIAAFIAVRKILPRLSSERNGSSAKEHDRAQLPLHNHDLSNTTARAARVSVARVVQLTFAVNIGLSTVLVELLLCEISNTLDAKARESALRTVLPVLMVLVVLVAPALEIQSVLAATGLTFSSSGGRRARTAWFFEAVVFAIWLVGFWYLGSATLVLYLRAGRLHGQYVEQGFIEGCMERIGAAGISLMACLSGFAAVSAVWLTFFARKRKVTASEVARRQSGLEATEEMLHSKRSRLRAVEHRMADVSSRGVFSTVVDTLRGTGDSKERSLLTMEINGLETMRASLKDTLYLIKTRKEEQDSRHTSQGKALLMFTLAFAIYCMVRLATVTFNVSRRLLRPDWVPDSSHNSDPVTMLLSVLANHWDPTINQSLWSRQISFLLSGVMLIAAFNSALQTFLVLGRAFPGLAISAAAFRGATTLALFISQIVATYVISAALLLRSSVPRDVGSVISDALGAPLEPARVDAWFEGWFLVSAVFTAIGIWAGNKLKQGDDLDGYGADVEMDKMS
jgi:hypothetical protein